MGRILRARTDMTRCHHKRQDRDASGSSIKKPRSRYVSPLPTNVIETRRFFFSLQRYKRIWIALSVTTMSSSCSFLSLLPCVSGPTTLFVSRCKLDIRQNLGELDLSPIHVVVWHFEQTIAVLVDKLKVERSDKVRCDHCYFQSGEAYADCKVN